MILVIIERGVRSKSDCEGYSQLDSTSVKVSVSPEKLTQGLFVSHLHNLFRISPVYLQRLFAIACVKREIFIKMLLEIDS